MRKEFENRLDAITWIADNAGDEDQFEVLREQLNFNEIYTEEVFINFRSENAEIVWLDNKF